MPLLELAHQRVNGGGYSLGITMTAAAFSLGKVIENAVITTKKLINRRCGYITFPGTGKQDITKRCCGD